MEEQEQSQQEAQYDSFDWYSVAELDFPEFNRDEVDVFAQAFKEFDTDRSGAIDMKELATALKNMGQGASPQELKQIMDAVDDDKSGEIEWPEFLKIMRMFYPDKRAQFVKNYLVPAKKFPEFSSGDICVFIQAFREFDEDASGSIDERELAKAFRAMGQGSTPDEIKKIIQQVDYDGSGEIEFGEFLLIMRMIYPDKRRDFIRKFFEPAKKFPEFSRDDIEVFVEAFREFDLDGSGSIDADELQTALRAMGQGATKEEIQKIIKMVDADGSGEIEWPEFLEIMRFFYPEKRIKFIKEFYGPARKFPEFNRGDIDVFVEAFKNFDADGSGAIDAQELGMALKAMGQGSSPQQVQQILKSVDADNSGEIEWPEFLQIMRNFYPQKMQEFEKEFYGPASKFPEFSRDDVAVFIQAFRDFDLDGSGAIDSNELGLALKSMGQGVTKDELANILRTFDADNSGEIEWPEYLAIMSSLYKGKGLAAAKTNTAPVAQKTTTATPVKQTATAPVAQKTTTAPTTFQPAQKTTTATPTNTTAPKIGAQKANGCAVCGKTVYPIEAINAAEKVFHKACFKCQGEGCGMTLNLSNFKAVDGKVYCIKHVPKSKPTSLSVDQSMQTLAAVSAPKLTKTQGIQRDARTTFGPGEMVKPDEKK